MHEGNMLRFRTYCTKKSREVEPCFGKGFSCPLLYDFETSKCLLYTLKVLLEMVLYENKSV